MKSFLIFIIVFTGISPWFMHMKSNSFISVILIITVSACVDRITFDIGVTESFPVVVEGFISDQPGPYKIQISKAFDIESKYSVRTPINVNKVVISDNQGNQEELSQASDGTYETSLSGIHGVVGKSYSLRIELRDGRVYESKPDTLLPAGKIDSIYFEFKEKKNADGVSMYSFDILFNSSSGNLNNFYFLWNFTGTFQADTHPELASVERNGCEYYQGKCNWKPVCSGLLNIASPDYPPNFIQDKPCECCTCWYSIFNDKLALSDNQLLKFGRFDKIVLHSVPLNGWIFMHKLHVKVSQLSLTPRAFAFWKSIKDQKDAANSLFQPITGKIPTNFIQTSGPSAPISGFFYSTSISEKSLFITRDDVPNVNIIPPTPAWEDSCLKLFPNSTTSKPDFWID
jgi:hypothetical protein